MTAKKSYNRYFIIFGEDDKGFGVAIDKQPTGYTKIETKNGRCKITTYVQNLSKDKGPYTCCLVDALKNPPLIAELGDILVDETGRGETWWEFHEDDIADTRTSADKFSVAAVMVKGDTPIAPLAGYIGKDRSIWKDKISLKPRHTIEVKETLDTPVPIDRLDDAAIKFMEYEESIKDNKDEINMEFEPQEAHGNSSAIIQDKVKFDEDIKNKTYALMFQMVLKDFEELKGHCDEIKGAKWWKVPYENNINLKDNKCYPYYCAVYHLKMTYPYINYLKYFKKCGYYYFGIKYDLNGEVKYIMYGIEGKNEITDQPYKGMTGFAKWVKLPYEDSGMWLMYYNPFTGSIMVPKER